MANENYRYMVGEAVAWRGVACKVVRQLSLHDKYGYCTLLIEEFDGSAMHIDSSRHIYPGDPRREQPSERSKE